MVGLDLAGQALSFISTTLDFVKDSRLYNKKKDYMKLLERLREAEDTEDATRDDNLVDHIKLELIDFLSVWGREIQTATMAGKNVEAV